MMGSNYCCRMMMEENLVFKIDKSLADMVSDGQLEQVHGVLMGLGVYTSKSFEHATEHEIRRFAHAIHNNCDFSDAKKADLINEYMPMIEKALVEAEDYNALIMMRENPKLYGMLSAAGEAIIEKYVAANQMAKEVFAKHAQVHGEADFCIVESGVEVGFKDRTLYFKFLDNGRVYKVYRFDS